jgi:uncharacterized protein (DUF2249 family)
MNEKTVTLDVREEIKKGREPFTQIMQAVSRLKRGEDLRLIAPFLPVALFPMMATRGFGYRAREIQQGAWEVLFTRKPGKTTASEETSLPVATEQCPCGCGRKLIEVDARGLESLQPLLTILEALPQLSDETELKASTDQRPLPLYAYLDERGYAGRTEERPDGGFVTYIHRCTKVG